MNNMTMNIAIDHIDIIAPIVVAAPADIDSLFIMETKCLIE